MKLFFKAHLLAPGTNPPPTAHFSVEFQTNHMMPTQSINQAQARRIDDITGAVATEQFARMMAIKNDMSSVLEERFDHLLQAATAGLETPQVYFHDKDELSFYMGKNEWSKIQDQAVKEFTEIDANGIKPKQPMLVRVQNDHFAEDQPPRKMSRGQSDSDMMF